MRLRLGPGFPLSRVGLSPCRAAGRPRVFTHRCRSPTPKPNPPTSDPKTVACQVEKLRTRFGLQRVVLVGDRGMLTAARIRKDLAGVGGRRWITTLRAPMIRKLLAAGTVTPSLFDERDLAEVTTEAFPGERLIVCRNPLLAAQRQRKRQELLAATEEDLAPISAATTRKNRPLRGAAEIGLRVGKVVNRHKVAKHCVTTITDDAFTFHRDDERIATEQQLDGLYIVRSNVEPEQFDAAQTVRAYNDLSKVERAFRSLKSVDLKVRPIHRRRLDRVRAHVLLCMLAYRVEWHMRQALAPLLFDDHDPAAAEQQRRSVVAPAKRSPAATGLRPEPLVGPTTVDPTRPNAFPRAVSSPSGRVAPGRPDTSCEPCTMSHRPWSELTKHWSPERKAANARAEAKLKAEIRRLQAQARKEGRHPGDPPGTKSSSGPPQTPIFPVESGLESARDLDQDSVPTVSRRGTRPNRP